MCLIKKDRHEWYGKHDIVNSDYHDAMCSSSLLRINVSVGNRISHQGSLWLPNIRSGVAEDRMLQEI